MLKKLSHTKKMFKNESKYLGTYVKNMEALPEDVLWYIYKKYWSLHVLVELSTRQEFLWRNPSKQLQDLCTRDKGSIQFGANDLWEMIDDHNLILLDECLHGECPNCKAYMWPCANMAVYGFENPSLEGIWGDIKNMY